MTELSKYYNAIKDGITNQRRIDLESPEGFTHYIASHYKGTNGKTGKAANYALLSNDVDDIERFWVDNSLKLEDIEKHQIPVSQLPRGKASEFVYRVMTQSAEHERSPQDITQAVTETLHNEPVFRNYTGTGKKWRDVNRDLNYLYVYGNNGQFEEIPKDQQEGWDHKEQIKRQHYRQPKTYKGNLFNPYENPEGSEIEIPQAFQSSLISAGTKYPVGIDDLENANLGTDDVAHHAVAYDPRTGNVVKSDLWDFYPGDYKTLWNDAKTRNGSQSFNSGAALLDIVGRIKSLNPFKQAGPFRLQDVRKASFVPRKVYSPEDENYMDNWYTDNEVAATLIQNQPVQLPSTKSSTYNFGLPEITVTPQRKQGGSLNYLKFFK